MFSLPFAFRQGALAEFHQNCSRIFFVFFPQRYAFILQQMRGLLYINIHHGTKLGWQGLAMLRCHLVHPWYMKFLAYFCCENLGRLVLWALWHGHFTLITLVTIVPWTSFSGLVNLHKCVSVSAGCCGWWGSLAETVRLFVAFKHVPYKHLVVHYVLFWQVIFPNLEFG